MKPLVKVRWLDARDHDDTWANEADIEAFNLVEVEVLSVGYLVSEGHKYLTIAGDYNPSDNDYGRISKIPIGMVLSKEVLETP